MGANPSRDHIEIIARGVLVHRGRALLCRNVSGGYLYLPGGHVEFGEPASAALAREFEEEAGVPIRMGACVLITENSFKTGSRTHHEINLVFHVERHPPDSEALDQLKSREPSIAFDWVELAAVVDLDVRPASAKAWLVAAPSRPAAGGPEWLSEIQA